MKTALVTGSSGLIGSEMVSFLDERGWRVYGVDNNMRRDFFGEHGDTTWNLERLRRETRRFEHHDLDVRDRAGIARLVAQTRPQLIVHAAAQPSHDLAAQRPFDDFEVNAVGTLNLLEAARAHAPETPFVFLSTNKVYGDAPNELELVELETRYDYADPARREGIYFGMPTVCLRGGCLTGPNHSSAELHGFLAYLARALRDGLPYRIYGYKGKQVRDNIHSYDVCTAIMAFADEPRPAAVYNLGGGRANSISMLEAIARLEELYGGKLETEYVEEPRRGDHVCYISDLRRFRGDYPGWELRYSLEDILAELVGERVEAPA
jgi:CDP-paratose 2-epimerase